MNMYFNHRMSYYTLLNVDPSCTQEQVKVSYKEMARLHHPDKNGDSEKFKAIAAAYATLSDAAKRAEYDQRIGLTR